MKLKIHLLVCCVALATIVACEGVETPSPAVTLQPRPGVGFAGMYQRNRAEIRGNLDILARALAQNAQDASFAGIVKQEAQLRAIDSDYNVSLSVLKRRCQSTGIHLPSLMQASLVNCRGTKAELSKLSMITDGFKLDGTAFEPVIFVPYYDRKEFPGAVKWDGVQPLYVGSIGSWKDQRCTVYDSDGRSHTFTEEEMRSRPTWFISLRSIAGEYGRSPSPLRFWARCGCQVDPERLCERCTVGFPTAIASCGRTGLFNENCSGSCPDECGHGISTQ
ncbi:MAG: hypothetical protein RLZZ165_1 [Bacteroidota bacterium]